jgi:hypothetical protein
MNPVHRPDPSPPQPPVVKPIAKPDPKPDPVRVEQPAATQPQVVPPPQPATGGSTPATDSNGGNRRQGPDSIAHQRAVYNLNAAANAVADPPPGGRVVEPQMADVRQP